MITLTDPSVDELQAVITAMCKVHPDLEVTGTLTIARAVPVAAGDEPAVQPRIEITTDQTAEQITEKLTVALAPAPVDPPREKPRRTMEPRKAGRPPGTQRLGDDRLREACAKVDQDKPIGPQLQELLGISRGSVFALHQRAIKAGWLRPSNRSTGLEAIERRPFDADAARMRAVGAI